MDKNDLDRMSRFSFFGKMGWHFGRRGKRFPDAVLRNCLGDGQECIRVMSGVLLTSISYVITGHISR